MSKKGIESKSIYAIINRLNNMVYVGQSNNPTLRFQQHASAGKHETNNTFIDTAIAAYGRENFDLVILEKNVTNYDEREKYWIKKMQSQYPNGYNINEGGATPSGVKNPVSMIRDQNELNQIIYELENDTNKSMHKIARDHGITDAVIVGINSGAYYHNNSIQYPIRQNRIDDDTFNRLVYSLKYELDKSLNQISEEYGVEISCLNEINQGASYHRNYLTYPLRSGKVTSPLHDHYMEIIDMLMNTDIPQKEIAKKFNVGAMAISNINLGVNYTQPGLKYPLRDGVDHQNRSTSISPDMATEIEHLLKDTDTPIKVIARRFELYPALIYQINNGTIRKYHKDNLRYPLRPIPKHK